MPFLRSNGIRLHYLQLGAGLLVGLLQGNEGAIWQLHLVGMLRDQFRLITYDVRGHGRSETPPAGYTSLDLPADFKSLMDALNIVRAHLVGHSYGGDDDTPCLHRGVSPQNESPA
jgi:pimeloyl-ACP methyl ester carboxylesterase